MSYVNDVFGEEGILSKHFPDYKVRPQQVQLSQKIDEALASGKPLLGEAPTGVGKSLAALVPAFRIIKEMDAPVLVVTSSIILQEQYAQKDVPFLESTLGVNSGAVLIKGKGNYLCLKKHSENVANESSSDDELKARQFVNEWARKTKEGDVNELGFVPPQKVWADNAIMNQNECQSKKCPFYDQCFYYKQRRKMVTSKLIITNYHYFFNALTSEGEMLPAGIKMVIMDEGHEVAAIARDFQAKKYNADSLKYLIQNFAKAASRASTVVDTTGIADELGIGYLQSTIQDMFQKLTEFYLTTKSDYKDRFIYDNFHKRRIEGFATEHYTAMMNTLKTLREIGSEWFEEESFDEAYLDPEEVLWRNAFESFYGGLQEKLLLLKEFFGIDGVKGEREYLYWMEPYKETSVTMVTKPFTAVKLVESIFEVDQQPEVINGAIPVIMSATLSVNKNFDYIKEELGIKKAEEIIVSSPFDLTNNMLWYLPLGIPEGNKPEHIQAVAKEMERIIKANGGRTMCLFTSKRNLDFAEEYLKRVLPKKIKVLSQNHFPKQRIIATMKQHPNVVIVATKSFFTGVDIQGQNLSAVLIDKLPFPMSGDPINDFLQNEPNGFHNFSLPETIITLKQGFGRLNRTYKDKGVVSVMDGRLATSGYKGRIFNSFDFPITATRDFEQIKEFLHKANEEEI